MRYFTKFAAILPLQVFLMIDGKINEIFHYLKSLLTSENSNAMLNSMNCNSISFHPFCVIGFGLRTLSSYSTIRLHNVEGIYSN